MTVNGYDLDMLREPYRALMGAGRTYAAFDSETTFPLIDALHTHGTIADPMAGYGTLMTMCAQKGISTFNLEGNPPAYLWGILNNPKNSDNIIQIIDRLLHIRNKVPQIDKIADISDDWYSPRSYTIIRALFKIISEVNDIRADPQYQQDISLALLVPFTGRLASYVPGNIVANVKRGGICVYKGLSDDFDRYLTATKSKLIVISKTSINKNHEFVFGNLITAELDRKFSAFITSPPYPNSRDYYAMFAPENDCLTFLRAQGDIENLVVKEQLIGSVRVSKYSNKNIDYDKELSSSSARSFIKYISEFEGKKRRAKYDNTIYYVPYFSNYFYQIEQAYRNFANYLTDAFEGYIVVTNNTARNRVIPVAQSIEELFHQLNINATIIDKYTRELSHVGTINPRVKGFKTRHMEYTIKVWRS